jgi:hypothetical protein
MAKSSIYFLTFTVSLNNVSGQPPIIFQIDFLSSFVPFPLNIQIDCFIWLFFFSVSLVEIMANLFVLCDWER